MAAAACAAALGVGSVWALSFGAVRSVATMGQPLDASFELVLQPGEMPAESCVSAQVSAGDTPVPASQVSAQLIPGSDGGARVRVRTSSVIEEPFLTVTLSVGCEVRFARQFTVFADPPAMGVVLPAQPVRSAAVAEPTQQRAAPAPAIEMAAAAARPQPSAAARSSSGEVRRAPRAEPVKPTPLPPNRARAAAVPAVDTVAPAQAETGNSVSEQRMSTGTVTRSEGVARLKLDTPTVSSSTKEDALMRASQQREEAMATAKIAVDVAEAANTSAAQKILEMEAQLAAARKELAEVQSALARLQAERAPQAASAPAPAATVAAEEPWYADYAVWLAAACAILLLLSGALYMRLRRSDSQRLHGWMSDPNRMTSYSEFDTVGPSSEQFALSQYSASPATIPAYAPPAAAAAQPEPVRRQPAHDEVTIPAALMPNAGPGSPPAGTPLPVHMPITNFSETQPSTGFDLNPISRFADISIEELLDVEQQAEFFVVLGQDDAAIELLTNHVMASGGASPMPFLKLLEIYRRTGDQTSYERTRKRFNARFNGVAPEWGADPNAGRGLVDYPEVLARIEKSWPNPIDAMAELQTLMFRNDSNLLFDLPAYRDIMTLFTLARDHHEGRHVDVAPVDVLLPLKSEPDGDSALPPIEAPLQLAEEPAPGQPSAPMDDNLRLALGEPSATVQVSVRRR